MSLTRAADKILEEMTGIASGKIKVPYDSGPGLFPILNPADNQRYGFARGLKRAMDMLLELAQEEVDRLEREKP